ncbi:hypothetical protein IP86_17340 [Rhodopseudomonas sp. AAP120]|uniref:Spy/CpxP family protein refolding chaperone n=1 Tax=Rhodopseudomonas TaxID=1073 RepID=UPI000164BED7|nr:MULTISPECIES: Spy/CpxP family protein refolding chaperone [Rhodopseudomonas]ACE99631.1 protein of unknown function DUF1520 [Rhodopseudomonas palustris TIE-1]KPF96182.1 hypothetical protein IP86_17340 [Rhodopseudomonas sp. AAP120]
MKTVKRAGTAILLALSLVPAGLSLNYAAATERSRLAMMDDDKMSKKPDSPAGGGMGQPGGQGNPNSMGGGRDDRMMKMQPPGQMQDCQGPNCQGSGMMMQMMKMMEQMHGKMGPSSGAAASGPADVTERLEGRIAFLKAELQISDKQAADWNQLADALRSSRQHLLEARKLLVMDDKVTGSERLDHYEHHLSERLEAIKSARAAFNRLYGSLNDGQKQTADAILLPLIATF